jgi:hypothetical protein
VERAQYFYISGFFLTVSPDSVQVIAKHASKNNKVNLLILTTKTLFLMLHVYADSQADWHLIKLAAAMWSLSGCQERITVSELFLSQCLTSLKERHGRWSLCM